MKILRRDPKIFRHPKVGSENIVELGGGGGGGSENLDTSKPA